MSFIICVARLQRIRAHENTQPTDPLLSAKVGLISCTGSFALLCRHFMIPSSSGHAYTLWCGMGVDQQNIPVLVAGRAGMIFVHI